jgi:TonB family protein
MTASAVALATLAATSTIPLNATVLAQTEKVYKPSEDASITLPRVIREVRPQYTPDAMNAKIQGTVLLDIVVLSNGDVGEVTVNRSLDKEHGLDDEAMKAARQWKFSPATKEGKAVAVQVTIEITFTLRS